VLHIDPYCRPANIIKALNEEYTLYVLVIGSFECLLVIFVTTVFILI